jgi:hypothetical protein
MSRRRGLAVAAFCLPLIAGCGSLQDAVGLGKRAPDEFAVVRRQPLIIPPDYGLRPPQPGEVGPQVATAGAQTRAALTGREVPAAPGTSPGPALREPVAPAGTPSEGESALLARTGGPAAASGPTLAERVIAAPAVGDGTDGQALEVVNRVQTPIVEPEE